MIFQDRIDAGRQLTTRLTKYADRPDVIVLALPRGGVPVAFEVSQELNASLDIFLVRKLGVPGHEELAMGAIASGGVRVLNDDVVDYLRIPGEVIDAVPVSARQTCNEYRMGVDEIICAKTPEPFLGVGQWYRDFSQTTDEEVRELLARADAAYASELESRELAHA